MPELFTIETATGVYVTSFGSVPTAQMFRHEFLAEAFINDAHDDSLLVASVLDLLAWLEAVQAAGIVRVREHTVPNTYPREVGEWVDRLKQPSL